MLKISIPAPCHEDWNKMTPDETGRHCNSCAKSVVDFTGMSDEEVKHFFLNKKEEKICGRFKQIQLQQLIIELPQNILSIEMPLWKKFLAACLIVFSTTLFSCETKINDQIVKPDQMSKAAKGPKNELKEISNGYVGMAFESWEITIPNETCFTTVGITIPEFINDTTPNEVSGDIEIVSLDSVNSKQIDTILIPEQTDEKIFTGDIILTELPLKKVKNDSAGTKTKTKNPPKADPVNCNTIKNYY